MTTSTLSPHATPTDLATASFDAELDAEFEAVVGDLATELFEQRWGQESAVLTGMPGVSTVHCLTVRVDPDVLPTL